MNLYTVLPDLPSSDFSNILPSLERSQVSVSDLLTLETSDVAKRAQIPTREVQRLKTAVLRGLHTQYGFSAGADEANEASVGDRNPDPKAPLARTGEDLVKQWRTISTLDVTLDSALGDGIPLGYLTEITGESGAGKTQLLLTLLVSIQLPPTPSTPHGLARNALYITTEAPLATSRLSQIIAHHPLLSSLPPQDRPSLSRILSISTPDLETQDHILHYQVPVAVKRHNIGLIVIDSITANYRAEFDRNSRIGNTSTGSVSTTSGQNAKDRSGAASMAKRTAQLTELGSFLRELARKENLAVVVANQVADRFIPDERAVQQQQQGRTPSSSHPGHGHVQGGRHGHASMTHAGQSGALSQPHTTGMISTPGNQNYDPLTLNHQQNFFTGWGDEPPPHHHQNMKTPSLGLVWSNQIAARIALIKSPARGAAAASGARWQRRLKVVFAPWVGPSKGRGVEFEIGRGGVGAVVKREDGRNGAEEGEKAVREGGPTGSVR